MKLLVAIHDVTPAFAAEAETLWDVCAARGIVPALFVVPSWHGEWHLEDHPRFCGWLRRCAALGAEVFLHGERHDESDAVRGLRHHVRALGRTNREGEFLTLPREVARNRIARGLRRLRALRLEPVGFVAPAWLASRGAEDAVSELGLQFSEDDSSVHSRGRRAKAPVIRWSARTLFRAYASVAVAAAARRLLAGSLVRVALHPQDLRSAPVLRSLVSTLDSYRGRAVPVRYAAI